MMDKFDEIQDLCSTLNNVSYQIAELSRVKEELEKRVSALLEHGDEGSKTYVIGKFKITPSTGYIFSLDKEEYFLLQNHIPQCFNPVKEKISYEIDKKIIRDAERYGSKEDMAILSKIITKKQKKLHVRISAAV